MCDCLIVFKGDYTAANRVAHHGEHRTRLWNRWDGMKKRCFYRGKNSKNYKDNGIGVCKQWSDSFAVFLQDMGKPEDGMSLDRINSGLHYCPHNVRWADSKMQSRNRAKTNGPLPMGVRYRKDTKKYFAVIWVDNKMRVIKGCYDNPDQAHDGYLRAKEELHGVFYPRS